jgi:hypothetical protein
MFGFRTHGIREKLHRGDRHLEELEREISVFLAQLPYAIVQGTEGEAVVGRFVVRLSPPVSWGVILGEAIGQYRSSLDHLIYQLALLTKDDPKSTAFPICSTREQYKESRRQYRYLRPEHQALVEAEQPFHSDDPRRDELARLAAVDNASKHRVIPAIYAVSRSVGVIQVPNQTPALLDAPSIGTPLGDGDVVYRLTWADRIARPMPVMTPIELAFRTGEPDQFVDLRLARALGSRVRQLLFVFARQIPELQEP